jgi:hypothetical protein
MLRVESPEATTASTASLQNVLLQEIQSAAQAAASAKGMRNLLPLDEGTTGDLPWFWQEGTAFNDSTYNWINNVFAFSSDGYVVTQGGDLTTSYFEVLSDLTFVLDPADSQKVNQANLTAAATINTLINDWITTQGPFPAGVTTQAAELNFIMTQVLSWGTPGLTLSQLRSSTNPSALLPNIPLGAEPIVTDLMTYLGQTSSVANIQTVVTSAVAQINATKANVHPQPAPTTPTPGFMETINGAIVPEINILESTANIKNALLPTSGGLSVSASYTCTKSGSNTVQVTTASGAAGVGDLGLLLAFANESSSQNLFSFDSTLNSCMVTLTFNGVTTFTPKFLPYNISTGLGWWNPGPIEQAANPVPNQSGYVFDPTPPFNFGTRGNFGVISSLLISQQPTISLTYSTNNLQAFQQTFQQNSRWGVTFLGMALGGGSSSYYQAQTQQDAVAGTVTLTMSPAGITTPISATDQFAYVIGAEILWPGAPSQS